MNTYAKKLPAHLQTARGMDKTPSAAAPMSNQAVLDQLSSLKSTKHQPTEELNSKISEHLGVNMPGLKIFEDEGLSEMGQTGYARGNEIHIAKGKYDQYSAEGQHVLLHEAAHVVQQGTHRVSGNGLMRSAQMENQAESAALGTAESQASAGSFAMPTGAAGPVQGFNPFNRKALKEKLVSAYDYMQDKKDDLHDFKKAQKQKMAEAYHGSRLENGVESVKGGFSKFGGFLKKHALSAKDAITKTGAYKAVAGAASSAKKTIKGWGSSAKNAVTDAYHGSWLENSVETVKGGVNTAASYVKKKATDAGNYLLDTGAGKALRAGVGKIRDKKNQFLDWADDKRFAMREHDDQRYMNRKEKKQAGYKTKMIELEKKLRGMDTVKERLAMNGKKYDDDSRTFSDKAPGSDAPEKYDAATDTDHKKFMGIAGSGMKGAGEMALGVNEDIGNLEDMKLSDVGSNDTLSAISDYKDIGEGVGKMVGGHKTGNKEDMLLGASDIGKGTVSRIANHAISDSNPAGGLVGGFGGMATGAIKYGVHTARKNRLGKLTDDDMQKDITDAHEKRMVKDSRGTAINQLGVNQFEDKSEILQGAIKAGGAGADMAGADGVGTAVATGANIGIKVGTKLISNHMKKKNAKYAAINDIFGSKEEYKKFKAENGLSSRDMKMLMARATDSDSVYSLGEHAIKDQQDTLHKHAVTASSDADGETGAGAWFKAQGYTDKEKRAQIGHDDIGEKLGRRYSDRRLKKSYRKHQDIA